MTHQLTNSEELLKAFQSDAVLGKIRITINKTAAIGKVEGGDGGPGTPSTGPEGGITWAWNLPLDQIYTGPNQTIVSNTLDACMEIIASVSMISCNSFSACGSGNYIGTTPHSSNTEQISFSGSQPYKSDSDSFPASGQLQIRGEGIDLSDANDGEFSQLSSLPVGFWVAQPVPGCTKRILGLFIEE